MDSSMQRPRERHDSSASDSTDISESSSFSGVSATSTASYPGDKSAWSQMTNQERLLWIVRLPFRFLLCLSHGTVFFVAYFGYMLPMLWAKPLWPRLYWFYESKLYRWMQASVAYWAYTAGYGVVEYGDNATEICENERVLLMCNHQSTADVPVLLTVLRGKNVASRKTIWIMAEEYRWTPFGMIGQMHGDHFILQGKEARHAAIKGLKKHLSSVFWKRDRRCIVLFPEGGFYYKRVAKSQKYGREHGYPHLEHITLPRLGAVKAILSTVGPRDDFVDAKRTVSESTIEAIKNAVDEIREEKSLVEARPPVKYVVDATIAYPHKKPLSIFTLIFGTRESCDIGVHYRVIDAAEVPFRKEDELRTWMYNVYKGKDELLDTYYTKGVFVEGQEGRRIEFELWKIALQQVSGFLSIFAQFHFYTSLPSWLLRCIGLTSKSTVEKTA